MSNIVKYLRVDEIVNTISETHKFNYTKLYAVNTSDVVDGKMLNPPFTETSELKGQFKKTIKKGDILFSEIRPANRHFAKVEIDDTKLYVASTKLMVLRKFNDNVDNDYFYYWLTNNSFLNILQRRAENRICSFPQITFDLLSEYKVPIPKYNIQQKISKILSTIDKKIELNNKINSELEAMARELYEYWFVQFDFPDENGKPYKSCGGKMVWNDELKREIPEGWSVENIGNVANLYQPKTLSGNDLLDDGKYFVYGANGIVGRYDEFNHKENEIAVCCRGASCGCFLMTLPEAWITGNAMVITPNSERVTKEYLYFGLSYDRIAPFITGSAQPQITRTNLETMKIIVPNKNILSKFNSFATGIRKKLQNVQYQINNLSELRDFLLPMLMNGQVTVK